MEIYLRPLKLNDALTSYEWRNNKKIWELTGTKPNMFITPEIELAWIKEVINNKNEIRFAICVTSSDKYIGNVQLTDIKNNRAEFHIFIGETSYWGKGIGLKATKLALNYGFFDMYLNEIFLKVNKFNINAIKIYTNIGFKQTCINDNIISMNLSKDNFLAAQF